jgi:hypothetical protein
MTQSQFVHGTQAFDRGMERLRDCEAETLSAIDWLLAARDSIGLSEATRRHRRALILTACLCFALELGFMPERVTALGIQFSELRQRAAVPAALVLASGFLLAEFLIYSHRDFTCSSRRLAIAVQRVATALGNEVAQAEEVLGSSSALERIRLRAAGLAMVLRINRVPAQYSDAETDHHALLTDVLSLRSGGRDLIDYWLPVALGLAGSLAAVHAVVRVVSEICPRV